MHRDGIRPTVNGVQVDVPIRAFVAGQALRYNGSTNEIDTVAIGSGISGPGTSVVGRIATWNDVTGTTLADSGVLAANVVQGPATATTGRVAVYNGASGKLIQDGTKLESDLVTGPASGVVGNLATINNASGRVIADGGIVAADVVTAASASVAARIPQYSGASGRIITDSGVLMADVVRSFVGPQTPNSLAVFVGAAPASVGSSSISITQVVANTTGVGVSGNVAQFTAANRVSDSGISATNLSNLAVIPSSAQRVLMSTLPQAAAAVSIAVTSYFVYVGFTTKAITVNRVEFMTTAAGIPTTPEVGLFSSPLPPNRAGQTVTKIVSGAFAAAIGLVRNTTAFAQVVPAGTHLWAGYRFAAGTSPTVFGHTSDFGDGMLLTSGTATTFAATASYAGGAVAASGTAWQSPLLRVTLDS